MLRVLEIIKWVIQYIQNFYWEKYIIIMEIKFPLRNILKALLELRKEKVS